MINYEELTSEKELPYSATIEITTKCNFRCEHCYIPQHIQYMETTTILRLINELKEIGVMELIITGGEPFLHNDIFEIIKFARSQGLRTTIFTNCYLLNENIIKQLSELYISEISTTLFSMNSEINDDITKYKGSLKKIINNLIILKKYHITVEIKVPIMKKNIKEYLEIKNFCRINGFKFNWSTTISSRLDGDRTPVSMNVGVDELREILMNLEFDSNQVDFNENDLLCPYINNNLSIDCNGNVYPCNSLPYLYGNIYTKTLKDIWINSEKHKKLLNIRKKNLNECKNCKYKLECIRCPGLSLTESSDILGCCQQNKYLAIARYELKKEQKLV